MDFLSNKVLLNNSIQSNATNEELFRGRIKFHFAKPDIKPLKVESLIRVD